MIIAGVPEHFNFPLVILSEKRPDHFEFVQCPGGSGEMASRLIQGKDIEHARDGVDLAVMLPEAALKFVDENPEYQIFGEYTDTPIEWGVYTRFDSDLKSWDDVQGKIFGISRYGSGSELMAYYGHHQSGWKTEEINFEVVQDLDGAKNAFQDKKIDVFLWEVMTSKKMVDGKEWRQIGSLSGDWPGFVFVGQKNVFIKAQITYPSFFGELEWCISEFKRGLEEWLPLVQKRFKLSNEGLEEAILKIKWSKDGKFHEHKYENLKEVLKTLGIIGSNNSTSNPFH